MAIVYTNKFITFKYFNLVVVPTVVHRHGVLLFITKKKESLMWFAMNYETPGFGGTYKYYIMYT